MSVFYFQNDLNKIAINIETKKQDDIYACFKQNCDKMSYENGFYSYKLNQENPIFYQDSVNNIEFISSKETLNNIKEVDLFNGHNYLKIKLKNLKLKKVAFLEKEAYSFNLPIQKNDKTLIQKAGVYFESIFYNWYFYALSYVLFLIYLIKYQQRFEFKIKYPILLILFLATFLRLSHIDFIPLWNDELYTLTFISNMGEGFNLSRAFLDAGNPPLFFIVSNIWLKFFSENVFLIRLLPLIIGVFQVYFIYLILRKILNEKIALTASFLSAINIFIILESNEIRSYILAMILVLASFYWFYKLKNEFSIKNLAIYSLISILLINTHYYCVLYVLANLFLGLFLLKKEKIKFLFANIISFLTFIPYFIITFSSKSLDENFNTWLEKPSLDVVYNHIVFYFGNIIFFIVAIVGSIFLYKKLEKIHKEIFIYNIYSISFVFIFAFLISMILKPILFERYFCIFLPFLIINTSMLLNIDFKTKFNPLIVCLIFLFSICIPKYENFNLFSNIDLAMNYSSSDFINQKIETYFVVPDKKDYAKYYPQIPYDKVIVSNYGVREDINLIEFYKNEINFKKGDKAILYLPEICINSKIKYSKELNVKKLNTTIVPIYKIVLE